MTCRKHRESPTTISSTMPSDTTVQINDGSAIGSPNCGLMHSRPQDQRDQPSVLGLNQVLRDLVIQWSLALGPDLMRTSLLNYATHLTPGDKPAAFRLVLNEMIAERQQQDASRDDPIPNWCAQCGVEGHSDEDPHDKGE